MDEYIELLGLRFLNGNYSYAKDLLSNGALMIVPSGPSLVILRSDDINYQKAMINSDFAIPDSGFMILLLKLFKAISIRKFSGLEFLRYFLQEKILRQEFSLFLIDPNDEDKTANQEYLVSLGIQITHDDHYVAPTYPADIVEDYTLLGVIQLKRPRFIMINLGGGVQEKLGYFLKTHLDYRPGIICTGAAIAFLTGRQVQIPKWVDKLYLGWLWRCLSNPSAYVPRYLSGLKLIPMVWKSKVEIINNLVIRN